MSYKQKKRTWTANDKKDGQDPDVVFSVDDARVREVRYIEDDAVMRTLFAEFYGQQYPPEKRGDLIDVQEAKNTWNTDPQKLNQLSGRANGRNDTGAEFGHLEEDIPDVEAFLREVMLQEVQDYATMKKDMWKRHRRATKVRAHVVVEYTDGESQQVRRALVVGDWCTFSGALPLSIRGKVVRRADAAPQFNDLLFVDASSGGGMIYIAETKRINGREFFTLLAEHGGFNPAESKKLLATIFTTAVSGAPADQQDGGAEEAEEDELDSLGLERGAQRSGPITASNVKVAVSWAERRRLQRDVQTQQQQAQLEEKLARRYLTAEQLITICNADSVVPPPVRRRMLFAPFVALGLRAVLLNADLVFIAKYYGPSVQIEALARGTLFVRTLAELLRTAPESLCITPLRKKMAREKQLLSLSLLPDLPFASFEELLQVSRRPDAETAMVGVDIYHNILVRDVYGYDNWQQAKLVRSRDDLCHTSGHMFSVFGMCSEEYALQYYHDRRNGSEEEDLRDPNTFSTHGRFAVPWTSHEAKLEDVNFVALAQSMPADTREMLRIDYNRLKRGESRSLVPFLRGLYWLAHNQVVVLERFIGTGKHNGGMLVDAFFMADVHELQKQLTDCLSSLVHCGRAQTTAREFEPTPPAVLEVRDLALRYETQWRGRYLAAARRTAHQTFAPSRVGAASKAHEEVLRGDDEGSGDEEEAEHANETLVELAHSVARANAHLAKEYEKVRALDRDDCKLYGAIRARAKPWRCWPLQRRREYTTRVGARGRLAQEQIDTLEAALELPILQVSGAGGVGKSEVIAQLCSQYAPEQVLCVAFTGQVASEMSRRTGFYACTIHSALFRHARFMEADHRVTAYRRHLTDELAKTGEKMPTEYTLEEVLACKSPEKLRMYLEYEMGAYPPLASPFEHVRVLIIDELSLVPFSLLVRLMTAIHAPERGRFLEKFYGFGDLDQLPAIEYGCPQSDLAHGLPHAVSQLVINHRSAGRSLFALSRAIAMHKRQLPGLPETFERGAVFRKIEDPTCDLVAIETGMGSLAEDIGCVYEALGAAHDPTSAAALNTQCIAPSNALVNLANDTIRALYHTRAPLEEFERHLERTFATHLSVLATRTGARTEIFKRIDAEREHLTKALAMRLKIGDRFFVTKNQRLVFKPRDIGEEPRELMFYNGRLLRCVGFYNAPKRITEALFCRCGLCPPQKEGKGNCMARLDQVPPRRAGPPPPHTGDEVPIEYHDHGIGAVNRHFNMRRMLVAIDESQNYVELDVQRMLVPRSRYGFGFALTTHKLQGSQARNIVYVCPTDVPYIHWKAVYTALTRARERVVILSSDEVFERLVRRKAPIRRSNLWIRMACALGAPGAPTTLGVWPQPLVQSADVDCALWDRFEQIRLSVGDGTEPEQQQQHQEEEEEEPEIDLAMALLSEI